MNPYNYCNFRPVTSGEILFQYIIKEVIGRTRISDVQQLDLLQIGGRLDDFYEYYVGVFAANILRRCIKKAERVVQEIDNESLHQKAMVRYFQESLEIPKNSNSGNLDRLAALVLDAELKSRKDISPSTRKIVTPKFQCECYVCGRYISVNHTNINLRLELEHIWPQCYGGDSIPENLIPACHECNNEKSHLLLWQNFHLHSFTLKPNPSPDELTSIQRKEKIAKHRRNYFEIACAKKISLKDAASELGTIDTRNMMPMDKDDAIDFFNFKF